MIKTSRQIKLVITSKSKQAKSDIKGISGSLKGLKKAASKVAIAYAAMKGAQQAIQLQELYGDIKAVRGAFNTLVTNRGMDPVTFLNDIKDAAKGTLSEYKTMTKVIMAQKLGLPVEEFANMMKIARSTAKQTGESVEYMLQSLVMGAGRQSRLILDNLGIIVSAEKAYANKAEELGITVGKMTEEQKKMAFVSEAMAQGLKKVEEAGGDMLTAADAVAQMQAKSEDAKVALAELLAPATVKILNVFTDGVENLRDVMDGLNRSALDRVKIAQSAIKNYEKESVSIKKLIKEYKELSGKTSINKKEQERLNNVIQSLAEVAPEAVTGLNDYGEALDINIGKLEKYLSLQKSRIWLEHRKAIKDLAKAYGATNKELSGLFQDRQRLKSQYNSVEESLEKATVAREDYIKKIKEQFGEEALAQNVVKKEIQRFDTEIERIKKQLNSVSGTRNFTEELNERLSDLSNDMQTVNEELDLMVMGLAGAGVDFDSGLTKIAYQLGLDLKKDKELLDSIIARYNDLDINEDKPKPDQTVSLFSEGEVKKVKDSLEKLRQELAEAGIDIKVLDVEGEIARQKFLVKESIRLRKEQVDEELEVLQDKERSGETLNQKELQAKKDLETQKLLLTQLQQQKILKIEKEHAEKLARENQEYLDDLKKSWDEFYSSTLSDEYEQDISQWEQNLQSKLDKLREFYTNAVISERQYYRQRREIVSAAEEELAEIRYKQWKENNKPIVASLDGISAAYDTFVSSITDMEMTGKQRREAIWNSFKNTTVSIIGDIVKEWIAKQLKMELFRKGIETQQLLSSKVLGTATAVNWATAAAFVNTATLGGASAAGSAGLLSINALAEGLAVAEKGMYVKRKKDGQLVMVGEGNDDEVIIPVSKFWDFLSGKYKLPGGYGIDSLPKQSITNNFSTASLPNMVGKNVSQTSPVNVSFSGNDTNIIKNISKTNSLLMELIRKKETVVVENNTNLTIRDKIKLSRDVEEGNYYRSSK